jgi:molybdenum cofactor biosynthesis enzyme MoaA
MGKFGLFFQRFINKLILRIIKTDDNACIYCKTNYCIHNKNNFISKESIKHIIDEYCLIDGDYDIKVCPNQKKLK